MQRKLLFGLSATLLVLVAASLAPTVLPAHADDLNAPLRGDWPSAGQNLGDTHSAPDETVIGPANAGRLRNTWTGTTSGSVSATPTVVRGTVYVPDRGGSLNAFDASSGKMSWSHQVSTYTGVANDLSRDSPAYWNGELVSGDGMLGSPLLEGARVFAASAKDGSPLWSTVVDSTPTAIVTGSPVVSDGIAYVGISSKSEAFSSTPTFRGSVVALNASTGKLLWRTYMVPKGYTGGAVWGSHPVVDLQDGTVIVGVGNNYSTPAGVCTSPDETNCSQPDPTNYIDAVVALDAGTGKVTWSRPTLTADTWTIAQPYGPDFDFGAGPNLYTTKIGGRDTRLVGIGQKSGVYWALDPATGRIVWRTAVGPGGDGGGIEWGTAVDATRIYVAVTNSDGVSTPIVSANGTKSTTTNGIWAALDPATGKILWQTAAPTGGLPYSSLTAANGVVYSGTLNATGANMFALNASTGTVAWSFASGGSVVDGPAVVDGTVYWGSGYDTEALGFPFDGTNNKVYAFETAK